MQNLQKLAGEIENEPQGRLPSQAKLPNQRSVPRHVFTGEIVEKLPPTTYHFQEANPSMGIFVVDPKVIRKLSESSGKYNYLDFYGTSVTLMICVIAYDSGFLIFFH